MEITASKSKDNLYRQDSYSDAMLDIELDQDSPFFNQQKYYAIQKDITQEFLNSINERVVEDEKNVTITIKGKPRTGKSWTGMGIYKFIKEIKGEKENHLDVIWTEEQLIQNRDKYLKDGGKTLIIDEDFRNRSGLGVTSVNEALDTINQTIGITGNNLIYIGVESQQPNVFYHLESISYNRKKQINKAFCLENDQPKASIYIEGHEIKGYKDDKKEFTRKIIFNEYRLGSEYVDNLAQEVVKELKDQIYLFSNEALKGFIRTKYKKIGLQENQLWAIFQIILSEKTQYKLKHANEFSKNKLIKQKEDMENELENL